jgi:hypothetical protein
MIKDISDLNALNKICDDWANDSFSNFWDSISPESTGNFNPSRVKSFLMNSLSSTITRGEILPYIKVWSFQESNISLSGCCFAGSINDMTGDKIFKEVLWQTKGHLANSIKEKKILIKLLDTAEDYARKSGFNYLILSRDPLRHKLNKDNNININNYYTRKDFQVTEITYSKKLN